MSLFCKICHENLAQKKWLLNVGYHSCGVTSIHFASVEKHIKVWALHDYWTIKICSGGSFSSISNVYVTRSIKKNFSAYLCWEQEVLWSSVVNLGSKLLTLVVFTLSITQLPPRKDAWYGFDVCDCY